MPDPHHMKAPEPPQALDGSVVPTEAVDQQIIALRRQGWDRMDPVGWHYIDALAQRSQAHSGQVRTLLDGKLAKAVAAFQTRHEQAQADGTHRPDPSAVQSHDTALTQLIRYIEAHAAEPVANGPGLGAVAPARPELKTVRYFRQTWSKLSVDKRLTQALDQAPRNAGPINSHRLVLQSLALMRDISPDYLSQFTAYIDTLLLLDQGEHPGRLPPKKAPRGKTGKK